MKLKFNKNRILILIAAFTVITPTVLWFTQEEIRYSVYEMMYQKEYDNLNDKEISKYNTLRVKDDVVINVNNKEDKEGLEEYLTYARATEYERRELYKAIEEGKMRIIKREVENTSNKDLICQRVMFMNEPEYEYEEINTYNERNGVYYNTRNIWVEFKAKESMSIYIFEYNEDGKFKVEPKKDSKIVYGYIDGNTSILINQYDNTAEIVESPLISIETEKESQLKVNVSKSDVVTREGVVHSIDIYNKDKRGIKEIEIMPYIKNKQGDRVSIPKEVWYDLGYIENMSKDEINSINVCLQEGEVIEKMLVKYKCGDKEKMVIVDVKYE